MKARLKFMVDDRGPEGMREEVERRLGYALPDFTLPAARPRAGRPHGHRAANTTRASARVGAPVHLGLISGDQMIAVAGLRRQAGDIRITRQQNLVLTGVADIEPTPAADSARSASPSTQTGCAPNSIGCTGEPHCNFAVTETKTPAARPRSSTWRARFGNEVSGLRLHLDGCPHACGQHWVGDLGFQGTTVRDAEGKRRQAYDVLLRGALGPNAAIGRPVFRRVPDGGAGRDRRRASRRRWLDGRSDGESFRSFCDRTYRRRARRADRPGAGPVAPRSRHREEEAA